MCDSPERDTLHSAAFFPAASTIATGPDFPRHRDIRSVRDSAPSIPVRSSRDLLLPPRSSVWDGCGRWPPASPAAVLRQRVPRATPRSSYPAACRRRDCPMRAEVPFAVSNCPGIERICESCASFNSAAVGGSVSNAIELREELLRRRCGHICAHLRSGKHWTAKAIEGEARDRAIGIAVRSRAGSC